MQHTLHRQFRGARRRQRGVTLLELMIVMVIVGILAAIGYPAYVDYSTRAKRKDGATLLLDAAARMERYYFDNNRYSTTLTDLGYGGAVVESAERYYVLNAAIGGTGSINTSYILTAVPNAALPFSDDDCGSLTLDNLGTQGKTAGSMSAADCWSR